MPALRGFYDMGCSFFRPVVMIQILALCMLLVCVPGVSRAGSDEVLKDFSAFSFPDTRRVNSTEMRGNILVMVFGSIYCKPCVELLPVMNELHDRYQDSDVRIILLDIDMGVDPGLQREFVARQGIKDPYINNALPIARDNKVYMLPTTLIVDREGTIVKRFYGFKKIGKFESAIQKLRPIIKGPSDPDTADIANSTAAMANGGDNGTADMIEIPAHHGHHP
jgi:thiol-disulfide isomerase/thioredoxin